MQYMSKHAVARKTSVKQRLAGVGIAGAATIVGGITTAGSAKAASVWDSVASCESGGNWHINTGNGYYGGLQFSAATWKSVGGPGLPHENSRETQIKYAKILQARSGWGQWGCAHARH